MLGVDEGTAEEFYSLLIGNAQVLDRCAHERARADDPVGAVACAWSADMAIVQAVVWERILIASPHPGRQFFQLGEAIVAALAEGGSELSGWHGASAEHVVRAARARLLRAFEAPLARDVEAQLPVLAYLGALPAITEAQMGQAVSARLLGLPPGDFVADRRRAAQESMGEAHARLASGDTDGAIQIARDADLHSLDAYLVESAMAVGDDALLTVIARGELATAAVGAVAGLSHDFVAAMGVLRQAMTAALGEADGARLRRTFASV